MNTTAAVLAGIVGLLAFAGIAALQIKTTARNHARAMNEIREQYIGAIAATLATPHMSPDGNHTEENRIIFQHWARFARDLFHDGKLSP